MDDEVTIIFWPELDVDIGFPEPSLWRPLIYIAQSFYRRRRQSARINAYGHVHFEDGFDE
jgi:hypothetical protein